VLTLRIERSRSKTGKHAIRTFVFLVSDNGEIIEARPRMTRKVKPTYVHGEAYEASFDVPHGWYLVYAWFVRNLRGRVKGYFEVYSRDAELLYRAVYRKLKLRRSMGDPKYAWIVRLVADHLNIPVKNTNLGDEENTKATRRLLKTK
jgi:hypothetical protein